MDNYEMTRVVDEQLTALSLAKSGMNYNKTERKLKELECHPSPEERLLDRLQDLTARCGTERRRTNNKWKD